MKVVIIMMLIFGSLVAKAAEQQQDLLVHKKISDHFYLLLDGDGANIGVIIGDDGILLVDTLLPAANQYLLQEIRKISDKPIKYVVNTHNHQDHSGGNQFFAKMGATIIFQENAIYGQNAAYSDDNTVNYSHLSFKNKFSLNYGGEEMRVHHESIHTFDDAIIYFPDANILFTGDIYNNNWLPMFGTDGVAGMNKVIDSMLEMINEETIVVPGHGDVGGKQLLRVFRRLCSDWISRLNKLRKKELSIDLIVEDKELNLIIQQFLGVKENAGIDAGRFKRFVSRVVKDSSNESKPPYSIELDKLSLYTGHYQLDDNTQVEIFQDKGKLYVRKPVEFMAQLLPRSVTHLNFAGRTVKGHFSFKFNKAGEIENVMMVRQGESYQVKKL
ncbi:MAG: MBL fold metallo-hydrolase [Algicola sp.]|nr:MBL fold metallo-hydrolase [Algicola sp.]